MLEITETNVGAYVGKRVRATKSNVVIEGLIRGRSDMVATDQNLNAVHPIEIETKTSIEAVVLSDGWSVQELN